MSSDKDTNKEVAASSSNNEESKEPKGTQKAKENEDSIDGEGIIPDEILDEIPEEERGKIVSVIKQSMFSGVMRRNNPVADKITEEHISQIISKSDAQDQRDREERKGERNYNLILTFIGLAFIGFLIVFLEPNKDLLINIILAIISFVGGFGFGKSRGNKQE